MKPHETGAWGLSPIYKDFFFLFFYRERGVLRGGGSVVRVIEGEFII